MAGRITRATSGASEADRALFNERNPRPNFQPGPGGLHRGPREVRSRPSVVEEGRKPVPETAVKVPRRAYSRDVINRGVQKGTDRIRARVVPKVEARAEARQLRPGQSATRIQRRKAAVSRPLTSQAKFERHQRQSALTVRDTVHAREETVFANNSPGAIRAMNKLKAEKHPTTGLPIKGRLSTERAAVRLHLDDVLPDPGKLRGGLAAPQIRDQWLRRTRGEQIKARKGNVNTANAREQLDVVAKIPDELLYLTGDSPAVKRVLGAVTEGRRLNRISQAQSVKAGIITNATRKEAATRASSLTVGGSRYWTDAVADVAKTYARKITVVNKRLARAKDAGNVAEVKRLTVAKKNLIKARKGRVEYIKQRATRESPGLADQRKYTAHTKRQLQRERKVVNTAGGSTRKVETLRKAYDEHSKRLAAMEKESRGFTTPRRPELVGKRGVYIKDKPVEGKGRDTGPRPAGRFGGPDQARRSKGRMKQAALNDMNPELLIHQAKRATSNYTGRISAKALDELMGTAAYRNADGTWMTGDKVSLSRKLDPEKVAYVHKGNLEKAMRNLDELPKDQWLDDELARQAVPDKIPEGVPKKDYIVISRDAAEVWREAMTSGSKFVRGLDTMLNYWKGGLLALSPRWYVNNTVGLALQYALLGGGDFKSVFQANRSTRPIRAAMARRSPQAVKDTLAHELVGNSSLPKLMRVGFQINSKLEEYWRRGAYLNRAKKVLREEGYRARKMSDQEVAHAIETMPEAYARNIVRDIDFFIGNYRKFNSVERNLVKRVIPFYSWLRVVARLTFVLPIRSPTRALAMSVLDKAQTAGLNPVDKALDYFERGPIALPGGKKIATWSLNPWQSLAGVVAALGDEHPAGRLIEEAIGWMHPGVQFAYSQATGKNAFGQGIITPPGQVPFGRSGALEFNQATRHFERQPVRLSFWESAAQSLAPGQVSIIKSTAQALAGNKTPYGDTSTAQFLADIYDRITGGKGNDKLYLPANSGRARTPAKGNVLTRPFGLPIYDQSDAKVVAEAKQQAKDAADEKRSLARSARRAGR